MRYQPTPGGGRILSGQTPYGSFHLEWDAQNRLVECRHQPAEPPKVQADPDEPDGCSACGQGSSRRRS